ncbi:hypothetical protein XENOCAPTIV_014026 [Xenoophorus captivus]|uniref:Uncharacterized protein n=1 Tax=Xenoophorus captivus TaxID=1517983 RepID=A0ABV0S7H0_9TELE
MYAFKSPYKLYKMHTVPPFVENNKHSNHRALTFAQGLCGLTLFFRFKDSLTQTAGLLEHKSPTKQTKNQTDQVRHCRKNPLFSMQILLNITCHMSCLDK